MSKCQLLLLDDVDDLGRSGEVVSVKSGYARNCLLPKKRAVIADKSTLKMQARLREERAKKAAADRKISEETANNLADLVLTIDVKVDPEGKLYGSVTALDIARLLKEKGHSIEKSHIQLAQPIKTTGSHSISLKFKEDVTAKITLEINPENQLLS